MNNKYLISFFFFLFSAFVFGQESPQVRIIQPLNSTVFDGEQIKVEFIVSGKTVNSARILIDDVPIRLLNDVRIGVNSVMVDVPARSCKISVIARNEYGTSLPAAVNLTWSERIFKPTLYILAIGVSNYSNPDLQLQFAAKDANDFSQAILRQEGLLYDKVVLRLLTDEQASAENVRDGLNWLQIETTNSDVAMLYMAGHGVNNNVGNFFFMSVNADINRINASCVGYTEIKETIDAIAGKIIVFMDACHSGNVLGNNQRRAAMLSEAISDLTNADNGAVVFTSSTGRQFSLENPDWNNGVFTKALVEGLNGKADLFDRKTITVNNLSSYVANRVKELTNGQQAPTTIIPKSVPDFPLAVMAESSETPDVNTSSTTAPVASSDRDYRQGNAAYTDNATIPENKYKPAKDYLPFYISATAGAGRFGSYSRSEIKSGGVAIFGTDVAYFINMYLAAGVKLNVAICDVNISGTDKFAYRDRVTFVGPALYGRLGKGKLALTCGAGVGALNWYLSNWTEAGAKKNNGSYTTAGGFISAGANFMFTRHVGAGLNVQSVIGSFSDKYEWERKPADVGLAFGLNFRF